PPWRQPRGDRPLSPPRGPEAYFRAPPGPARHRPPRRSGPPLPRRARSRQGRARSRQGRARSRQGRARGRRLSPLYLALVHHPVRDRLGETVTTAVTNIDVHDLARTARTYDLAGYFVVTPITAQQAIVARILTHFTTGAGRARVPA